MRTAQLSHLYQSQGPFASVTLDVSRDTESGEHEQDLRVRDACQQLSDAGADEATVQSVSQLLSQQVSEAAPVGRTVVLAGGSVVFDELVHTRVDQPLVSWGALPDVTGWVEREDGTTSFVLAVVDHEGGDVAVYTSDVPDPQDETSVNGETDHIQKVPAGGWSSLRYQHVTENVWKQNAEAVAAEIESYVRAGHRLVLLAGDPHSRSQVVDSLGDTSATVVQLTSGSRARDGGDDAFQQAVREVLHEQTVARRVALAHTIKDRLGRDDAAVTGVDDVAEALVRGQVETLLLDPTAAAGVTLDPAQHPGLSLGPTPVEQPVRADQALIAAAALTGADVAVSPSSTLGGAPVAALLRWDQDPATASTGSA
jgi:hypothetical protein